LDTSGGIAFSVDELRALARLSGAPLPPLLLDGWHADDGAVADTVAVRSLLARGAVRLTGGARPTLALTTASRAEFAPLLAAEAYAELTHLPAGGVERRQIVVQGAGDTLLVAEREPDVWTLHRLPGSAEQAAAALAADLLDGTGRPVSTGSRFVVLASTLRQADEHVRLGDTHAAVAALTAVGVPHDDALAWTAVLRHQAATGTVRLARQLAPEVYLGGEVCWVDAGPAGVWRVEEAEPPYLADTDGEDTGGWYADGDDALTGRVLSDVGMEGLQAALAALLMSSPAGVDVLR
jgi:hypothetical protein